MPSITVMIKRIRGSHAGRWVKTTIKESNLSKYGNRVKPIGRELTSGGRTERFLTYTEETLQRADTLKKSVRKLKGTSYRKFDWTDPKQFKKMQSQINKAKTSRQFNNLLNKVKMAPFGSPQKTELERAIHSLLFRR